MYKIGFISTVFAGLLSFSAYATPLSVNGAVDTRNTPTTVSKLPTCNSSSEGSIASVTDNATAVSWGSVVTGGGTSHVAVYCDGTSWKVFAGVASIVVPPPPPPPVTSGLAAPTTNQGNYATGCSGGTCLTFDDHWAAATLDNTKWLGGLYINGQYLNGGIGLSYPFSGWTVGNTNGGTNTAFFDYPYGYAINTAGVNFLPLSKASDGSLQFGLGLNSYVTKFSSSATYVGSAISSAVTTATEIMHTGGLIQFRTKFDQGLQYGSYPGMQCSSVTSGASGTTYNSNVEWGYTWTGTALTNIGMSMNNVTASAANDGATSSTGVYQVPATNDWTNWHTVAVEYTGDTGTKKWQWYVDGTLVNSVAANHPTGTDFNCSFQLFNSVTANNGWHSVVSASNPGPFYGWISDFQFYKKPGT